MLRLPGILVFTALLGFAAVACSDDSATVSSDDESVRVFAAADQEAFRQSIVGRGIVQETCGYEPERNVADCGERGRYTPEPPPEGDDASCVVGLSRSATGGETAGTADPAFLLCSSQAAQQSKFYAIGAATPAATE